MAANASFNRCPQFSPYLSAYQLLIQVHKKASRIRDCDRVVEAPAPARPIERGLAAPDLLAHVLVSKFADHMPLYRQSEIFAREGIDLDRSTLAGWVGAASELVAPLVDEIRKYVLAASKIHADDTPVPVLAPGNGKTRTGRLWTYVRDDRPAALPNAPAVWFAYSEDRRGEHLQQHLKDFTGALQADAYSGLHHLYGDGRIYEVGCWAHARRKFYDTMSRTSRPPRPKPSTASVNSTPSRKRFAENHQSCAVRFDKPAPSRCSKTFAVGWRRCSVPCRLRATPLLLFAMHLPLAGTDALCG
jgi:hypothetical protein